MRSSGTTSVLIVGAGPAGLALAIELGHRGIDCLVVEQNNRVGLNPRAKTTNVRTREHLRRWGIADDLRRASRLPADYSSDIVFVTRMNGPMLTKIENAMNFSPERNDLYSESGQWVPQYVLEEVMRTHAATLPSVTIRFGASFLNAQQDEQGVTATIESVATGEQYAVRSAYLVGADGSRSKVREVIGAEMQGAFGIAQNLNIQFRAPDLARLHSHPPAVMYWLVNGDTPAILGPMEDEGHWYFVMPRVEGKTSALDPKELIRQATGVDFELEILGSSPWTASSLIANKYAEERIFLAGDACHLHPPFGGYGINMGGADGVDLGWKLAAVLEGWGGQQLLASYEQERRPIHVQVIEEAVANYNALGNHLTLPGLEAAGPVGDATRREAGDVIFAAKLREFKTLGVVLGYRYADSPIVVPDGTVPPVQHPMIYRPSAYPGCLAPHLWLEDGTSLYDHFGAGLTLLAVGKNGAEELHRAEQLALSLGIPLKVLQLGDARLPRRYGAAFTLIRPDQHVAWRGERLLDDFATILRTATGSAGERTAA